MFGWILIGASTVLMYKIADMGEGSGAAWAGVTFVLCLACGLLIPIPLLNILIGLILSYAAMVTVSIVRGP